MTPPSLGAADAGAGTVSLRKSIRKKVANAASSKWIDFDTIKPRLANKTRYRSSGRHSREVWGANNFPPPKGDAFAAWAYKRTTGPPRRRA
jgi:hypothetical protein